MRDEVELKHYGKCKRNTDDKGFHVFMDSNNDPWVNLVQYAHVMRGGDTALKELHQSSIYYDVNWGEIVYYAKYVDILRDLGETPAWNTKEELMELMSSGGGCTLDRKVVGSDTRVLRLSKRQITSKVLIRCESSQPEGSARSPIHGCVDLESGKMYVPLSAYMQAITGKYPHSLDPTSTCGIDGLLMDNTRSLSRLATVESISKWMLSKLGPKENDDVHSTSIRDRATRYNTYEKLIEDMESVAYFAYGLNDRILVCPDIIKDGKK